MISSQHLSPVEEPEGPVGFLISLHDRRCAIVRVMKRLFAFDNLFLLTKKRKLAPRSFESWYVQSLISRSLLVRSPNMDGFDTGISDGSI